MELGEPGVKYEIELYSTLPNTRKEVRLKGSTTLMVSQDSNPLSVAQVSGKLYGDNLNNATFLLDGEEAALAAVPEGAHVKVDSFLPFTDVPTTSQYYDAVRWAVEQNITKGTSSSPKCFSPNSPCKHNHILTFLWRANHAPMPVYTSNPFSLNPDSDFGKAALWAYGKNMISSAGYNGYKDCTRAEAVMYLWKFAKSPSVKGSALTDVLEKFTDVSPTDEYAQAVAWAVSLGITRGTSDTTFSPDRVCTRGQIVTFLYRCYGEGMTA